MSETGRPDIAGVRRLMHLTALALVPGLALGALYGSAVAQANIAVCLAAAAVSAVATDPRLRAMPRRLSTGDGSTLLTALLLAAVLPPAASWYVALLATASAILLGKAAYGGLGRNPYNPAMVGIALSTLAFPGAFAPSPPNALVGAAFACGGLFLLLRGVITWHAPIGMLVAHGACVVVALGAGLDPRSAAVSGTMLAGALPLYAFFFVTDPVTGATARTGQIVFGAGVGLLTYIGQAFATHPAAAAYAVLLANAAVPLIDRLTLRAPRRRTADDNESNQTP